MAAAESVRRGPLRVAMVVATQYESDSRVRRQAEALTARGDQVTVLALHAEDRPREDVVDGVRVLHLATRKYRGDSVRGYLALYGSFAVRAAAWLARRPRSFDLVQVHSMPEALVLTAGIQRAVRVPLLLDVHDLSSRLFAAKFASRPRLLAAVRGGERASFRFASEVLTVHEVYAEIIRGMTSRPVRVVMNCPDERLFARRAWRTWDPTAEVTFGYHGLIAPRHGLVPAVEALAAVRRELPGAGMRILGSGDGQDELAVRVRELGLTRVVDLPTRLHPITEVVRELDAVHIGVIPSHLDPWTSEVLPTKLLEYAVLGIPIITFRNPVIARYFPPDAVTYVDPANTENLRTAMLALASDPQLARRQADRAAAVMDQLTWQEHKHTYYATIDRLVTGRRG